MIVKQEVVNINFKVIALTQLGIKPESAATDLDPLFTQPSYRFEFLLSV